MTSTHLPEQTAPTSATEVDVDVVVLATDGLFDERLLHDLPVDDDRVSVRTHGNLGRDLKSAEMDANFLLHDAAQLIVDLRPAIAGHF